MSEEENKALVRREFDEIWNGGQLEVMDEVYAADLAYHSPGSPDIHGPEGLKPVAEMLRNAFPDIRFTLEDMVAEGDMVAVRWTLTGTNQGELMGVPPTGVPVEFEGNSIIRFDGGKYAEIWSSWDVRVMWLQLGVNPPLGTT